MMSFVIVKRMVDLNILKVDEGHNLPYVTIINRGKVCMKLFLLHKKEIIQLWKHNGLCRDLDYKNHLEFYLSCVLELLETHMLSYNFFMF
jgi:hypothetical protein